MPRLDGSAFSDAMAEAQRKAGGGVRQRPRRQTAHEVALDCAAEAEYLAQQLRAIADAAALPPPEAFAPSLDPDEMPDDDELAMVQAQAAVPVVPTGTTALLERSSRATRVDFACRPVARPDRDLSEALKTLQRLSEKLVSRRGY